MMNVSFGNTLCVNPKQIPPQISEQIMANIMTGNVAGQGPDVLYFDQHKTEAAAQAAAALVRAGQPFYYAGGPDKFTYTKESGTKLSEALQANGLLSVQ